MDMRSDIVSSGLTAEKRKFTWRIENFDMVRNSDELIDMQKFEFKAGKSIDLETDWVFRMGVVKNIDGKNVEKPWIIILLGCTTFSNNVKEVNVTWRISIKKAGKYEGYNRSFKRNYTETDVQTGAGGYIFRKDAKVEELPLIDGSLIVEMEVNLFTPVKITTTINGTGFLVEEFERKSVKKLQSDMGKLLNSSEGHSEVETKIISKDNVEFGVNVGILSARSPVFKTMLGTEMLEVNSGVIRIDELSSKTISVLLRFIYTGTIHEEWSKPEVIVQLVYAAEKYQLPDLVEFLDNVLGQVSTKETGVKLFNLAKKLGMKKAEKEIFEKIKRELSTSDDLMTLISKAYDSDN